MELEQVDCRSSNIQISHMKGGEGDGSYAENSLFQRGVILKTMPLIQESIHGLLCNSIRPECLNFADLGCSSGPNSYQATWQVIEALDSLCCRSHSLNCKPPMLQVFLNDLPGNDFNTVFKSLPSFYQRLKIQKGEEFGRCFIAAVPGSFYGRLFPNDSLHMVFSSYSVHWLSQAPKGLLMSESGISLNRENIYIARSSPASVHKAYLDQFESDFTIFLRSRSEEMKAGGRMILTLNSADIYHPCDFELLGIAINDMVSEGLIEESKLESFNLPFYTPRVEELRNVIEREASFDIHKVESLDESWVSGLAENKEGSEVVDKFGQGRQLADETRSILEPLLATHFGHAVMDDMFRRYSLKITEYLELMEAAFATSLIISLIKK